MKKHFFRALLVSLLAGAMMIPMASCTVKDVSEDTTEVTKVEMTDPETIPLPEVEVIDPADFGAPAIVYDCDDGSILSTYNDKTAADFEGVCHYYEKEGYVPYSTGNMGENLASTFVKDDAMAHIYWHPSNQELNIVLSETAGATLPPAVPEVTDGDYVCSVVQIMDAGHVNGMCYIIQLKDGSYIIYDGSYSNQINKIERYLIENYKGEGKPIIRAWVLTHSHNDHYPAFQTFVKRARRGESIMVEHIIVSPMNDENYFMNDPNDYDPYLSTTFYEEAAQLKGTKVVFAHTGMKFTFCNLNMEILYAPESYYKTSDQLGNFNNTSIVSRLYGDNYSALFTADVGIQGSTIMENLYGDYLKSDICQISHHGVEDVPLSFYEYVQASILYYPCDLWLYDQTDRHWEERKAMEKWDCTKEILIAGLGQYVREWGTTFDADAPLSMPDYPTTSSSDEENEEASPSDSSLLSVDKTAYTVGEPIMVTASGSGTDWIGIALEGANDSLRWWYVSSVGSETPFDLLATVSGNAQSGSLPAGTYEIRLIPNDKPWSGGDVTAQIQITITEAS